MNREREIYKVTLVGSVGNAALLAFKFVAGIIGHSPAMIADAVHSLSDFVTDVVVMVFVNISAKPQDMIGEIAEEIRKISPWVKTVDPVPGRWYTFSKELSESD